ncbi:low molecular weight protein tyrosine phosphatase family protein [Roseibium sp. SCP14]|uniref:low molecular weight protein tyrosine phosphatase family protein n=1 Tax=Roseibium sp. SCP14 TaxID=3141375 RepID=UPI003337AFCD
MTHPADKGLRRTLARKHTKRRFPPKPTFGDPKQWKLIYLRSNKLIRARKTGRLWPHPKQEWDLLLADTALLNVLFVCSRNQWRSPTGEATFRKVPGVATRSAGTSRNARRTVSMADIRWADLIFVMEQKHRDRLRAEFRQALQHKKLHVLDIPDEYRFMDTELVELFEDLAGPLIEAALQE